MAARRMIHSKISRSKQVNRMSDFSQLVFTWTIAHADDFGCIDGDPEVLLATVIPMRRDKEPEDMEKAIIEWVNAELVWWYEVGGQKVVQFRTWDTHQSGLHKRTKSKFPMHEEIKGSESFRELPGNSPLTELNRTELKGTEEKRSTNGNGTIPFPSDSEVAASTTKDYTHSSSSLDLEFGQVTRMYEAEGFGQITETTESQLGYLYDTYGNTWMIAAMEEAVLQNKRRLSYVKSILSNWKTDGGMRRSGDIGTNQGSGGEIRGIGKGKSITGGQVGWVRPGD